MAEKLPKGCFLKNDPKYGEKYRPLEEKSVCNKCTYHIVAPNGKLGRCKRIPLYAIKDKD
jgi:hypothetical protein